MGYAVTNSLIGKGFRLMLSPRRLVSRMRQERDIWRRRIKASLLSNRVRRVDVSTSDQATTPEQIASKLQHDSFSLIRGALSSEMQKRMYDLADRKLVKTREDGNNLIFYLSEQDGAGESGPEYKTDIAMIRALLTPTVVDVAQRYFMKTAGTADFILPYVSLLMRRFDGRTNDRQFLPYHQDGAVYSIGTQMLNLWTLLYPDECGQHSSAGLDLLPLSIPFVEVTDRKSGSELYSSVETKMDRVGSVEPYTPSIRAGDILMFNEVCLHRTSLKRTFSSSRVSAEVRLFAATKKLIREHAEQNSAVATVADGVITWPSRWTMKKTKGLLPFALEYSSADLQ